MRFLSFIAVFTVIAGIANAANDPQLKIDVTNAIPDIQCTRKTKTGDDIGVNYRGTLEDGSEFDSSYSRGKPISFTLGVGQVIEGWDKGLIDMCIGEKRTLHIPYQMAYGERGAGGVIPPRANLIFETELVSINNEAVPVGRTKDEF